MKAMKLFSHLLAPSVLAIALGAGFAMPVAQVRAQDELARVLVDIGDVVFRAGVPYYRFGDYGRYDRLFVQRDRYGRPVYYRYVPVRVSARQGSPRGNAYGLQEGSGRGDRNVECNDHGRCKVTYYDSRYDDRAWWDGHR
ncbi:MAG: hypothetical protein QM719_05580 [Thermomonas sp.]